MHKLKSTPSVAAMASWLLGLTLFAVSCSVKDAGWQIGDEGGAGGRASSGSSGVNGGAGGRGGANSMAGQSGSSASPGSSGSGAEGGLTSGAGASGSPPNPQAACETECPGPAHGSGTGECQSGVCGLRCAEGHVECAGGCVNLQENGEHCGACNEACSDGLVCQGGTCTSTCAGGLSECQASCVDLNTAVSNCKECGVICPSPAAGGSAVCEAGVCGIACDKGLTECDGMCVNLASDLKHCGGCGDACAGTCSDGVCCPTGQTNCGGTCTDLRNSAASCGACGTACTGGKVCMNGSCTTDCGAQKLCGSSCVDANTNIEHCGGCNMACPSAPANGVAVCAAGKCGVTCAAPDFKQCVAGSCTNITTETNCGDCGKACGGVCSKGVCCPAGRVNCNGTCVNLQTDAKNCLSCGRACAAGEVCEGAACVKDCGTNERCGTTCANLATDLYNCGECGTRCAPPAANGTAVCLGAAGCDIKCNAVRCGNNCCPAPAAGSNTVAGCNSAGTQCAVSCQAGYHACNGTASPCYKNDDVQRCGASCFDCRQANATAACSASGNPPCANTCEGTRLSCQAVDGKPACGSWDFESGTTEGWTITGPAPPWEATSALNGALTTSTTQVYSNTRSLAFEWQSTGGDSTGRYMVNLAVPLCPSGAADLAGRTFTFHYYLASRSGTATSAPTFLQFWNGNTRTVGSCDTELVFDRWSTITCSHPDIAATTSIELVLRIFGTWRGTFYTDGITIE